MKRYAVLVKKGDTIIALHDNNDAGYTYNEAQREADDARAKIVRLSGGIFDYTATVMPLGEAIKEFKAA